jgi:Uma2 family endonuclease
MSTASATSPALVTAEEFAERPDPGYPEELVRGRIVPMTMPKPRHGEICARTTRILGNWVDDHDLGRVLRARLDLIAPIRTARVVRRSSLSDR